MKQKETKDILQEDSFKMKKTVSFLFALMAIAFVLASCEKPAQKQETAQPVAEQKPAAPAPTEEAAAGFDEFPIGDEQDVGPLHVGGVYFQPVDMEPAGNSLSKNEADCHIEADIHANDVGKGLGYGVGDFVPYLHVKAYIQKQGSSKVQEVAFMPMNADDGPHYGANMKFEEGLGKYTVKFEIKAPGNDYLLHVDKETGVTSRFWTEPLIVEWDNFEWKGPQW